MWVFTNFLRNKHWIKKLQPKTNGSNFYKRKQHMF